MKIAYEPHKSISNLYDFLYILDNHYIIVDPVNGYLYKMGTNGELLSCRLRDAYKFNSSDVPNTLTIDQTFKHCGSIELVIDRFDRMVIYKDTPWYDNISPDGVLCWVWNGHPISDHNTIGIVFNKTDRGYITLDHNCFAHAEPCKITEITNCIYGGV